MDRENLSVDENGRIIITQPKGLLDRFIRATFEESFPKQLPRFEDPPDLISDYDDTIYKHHLKFGLNLERELFYSFEEQYLDSYVKIRLCLSIVLLIVSIEPRCKEFYYELRREILPQSPMVNLDLEKCEKVAAVLYKESIFCVDNWRLYQRTVRKYNKNRNSLSICRQYWDIRVRMDI